MRRIALALVTGIASVVGAAEPTGASGASTSYPIRFEYLETTYRLENDGTGVITVEVRIRAQDETGRASLVQVPHGYASASETARFLWLRTRKKDGTVVTADPAAALDMVQPVTQQAPMYSDLKALVLPVPAVSVGDIVEYRAERRIVKPLAPGEFWVLHFPLRGVPVDREVAILDVPDGRAVRLSHDPDQSFEEKKEGDRVVRRWTRSAPNPPPEDDEATDPPRATFAASTFRDFTALGAWYLGLQERRGELPESARALLDRLVAGRATAKERLEAIFTYVARDVSYLSLSFGIGGFRPHPAAEVLATGTGDCKDKDLLLRSLLRAAGIPASSALVQSQYGVIDAEVPVPSQFDHVITVAYADGTPVWLDASLGVAPPGVVLPVLFGKRALVMEPGGSRLAVIERSPFVENVETLRTTGTLEASGRLTTDTRYEVRGEREIFARGLASSEEGKKLLARFLVQRFRTAGDTELDSIETSEPGDLSGPFWIRFHGVTNGWVSIGSDRSEVHVPGLFGEVSDRWTAEEIAKSAARGAIDLEGPRALDVETVVAFDPSWRVIPPASLELEGPALHYESKYALDGNRLTARRSLQLRSAEIAPDRERETVAFGASLRRDSDQRLIVRRAEGADVGTASASMDADSLNGAGLDALDSGKLGLAEELLKQATVKDPNHGYAWNNLGRVYLQSMRLDEAEKAFLRQVEVRSEDEYAHANLGWVYLMRGRYDDAIARFRRQIEINPLDPRAHSGLGQALSAAGRTDEALAAFRRALEVSPEDGEVLAMYGLSLLEAGRVSEAREPLAKSAELDVASNERIRFALALLRAGAVLDLADRFARRAMDDAAARVGQVTLDQVPDGYYPSILAFALGHTILGEAALAQERHEQAIEHLSVAFDLGSFPPAAFALARALTAKRRYDEALRYYALGKRGVKSWSEPPDGDVMPESTAMPGPLAAWAREHVGDASAVAEKLETLGREELYLRLLEPVSGEFVSPRPLEPDESVEFDVQVLVDESGAVVDSRAEGGREPWASSAVADMKRVRFHPLAGSGRAIRSLRTVHFFYLPGNLVRAYWDFRIDPGTARAVDAALDPEP